LQQSINALNQQIALKASSTNLGTLQEQVDLLQTKLQNTTNFAGDTLALQSTVDALKTAVYGNADITALSQTLATQVANLEGEVTANDTDIGNLQTAVGATGDLQQSINALNQQIALKANTSALQTLQGEVDALETALQNTTNLAGDTLALQSTVDALKTAVYGNADITALTQTLATQVANLESEVTANNTDIGNLQTAVGGNDSDIGNLQTAVGNLQTAVGGNDSDITNLQNAISNIDVTVDYVTDVSTGNTIPKYTITSSAADLTGNYLQPTHDTATAYSSTVPTSSPVVALSSASTYDDQNTFYNGLTHQQYTFGARYMAYWDGWLGNWNFEYSALDANGNRWSITDRMFAAAQRLGSTNVHDVVLATTENKHHYLSFTPFFANGSTAVIVIRTLSGDAHIDIQAWDRALFPRVYSVASGSYTRPNPLPVSSSEALVVVWLDNYVYMGTLLRSELTALSTIVQPIEFTVPTTPSKVHHLGTSQANSITAIHNGIRTPIAKGSIEHISG